MTLRGTFFVVGSLLLVPCLLKAQTTAAAGNANMAATAAQRETVFPDQGYLSSTRYTNRYFGFAFDFPEEAELRSVARPMATDGSLQLLDLAGPPPSDAAISLVALRQEKDGPNAKLLMRRELDHDLYVGVEELRPLSKTGIGDHEVYFFETRRGIEQHMLLATDLDGYVLEFTVAAHSDKLLKRMEAGLEHMAFFSPLDYRQHLESDAVEYQGPAISTHRLAEIEADPPAQHLDPGTLTADSYRNRSLGFSYQIPAGWVLEAEGAIEPSVERSRARNTGAPAIGRAENVLLKDCGRTLFSAWARRPGPDGQIAYDGFGEITLSALALACFPAMSFPTNASDVDGFKAFISHFALTHPILQDMRESKSFSKNGAVFLFFHGAVAFQANGEELSRRLSIAMAVTQRHGYIVTWFFAAPHDAELQDLLDQRVNFDPETPVERAATGPASIPGGGRESASSTASASPGGRQAEESSTAANAPASATSSSSQPSPAAAQSSTQPSPAASPSRPSLLRPGETMEGQQGNGPPLKH